jgi:hypothetical protein
LDLEQVFAESDSDEGGMAALMQMAEQQNGQQSELTVQATLFKITTQISDLQVGGFDSSYLQVPEGYQRVEQQ